MLPASQTGSGTSLTTILSISSKTAAFKPRLLKQDMALFSFFQVENKIKKPFGTIKARPPGTPIWPLEVAPGAGPFSHLQA
jgi:hypothetical protein